MNRFVVIDRDTPYLFPPSVDEWLPQDHLARFVVEIIERMDLGEFTRQYAGRGSAAYPPAMMLGLLVYGYATGVHSSRKIERACHDSVAFRFIAANTYPDHDSIANFRRRFLKPIENLFVQVLMLAREMKCLRLGTIALDGTKIAANASKHKALSWEYANRIEGQLRQEVQMLLELAESTDQVPCTDGMDVPAEIARRKERLQAIEQAKVKIKERARERYEREQDEYQAKQAHRQELREAGKKPRGKEPEPPSQEPRARDQVSLTDEQSRIMPSPKGGFVQAYNAQAAVDTQSMLVVACDVSQGANDQREVAPMLEHIKELPQPLGSVQTLLADSGYCSAANVRHIDQAQIEPLLALQRQHHHLSLLERFAPDQPCKQSEDAMQRMVQRLKTKAGKAVYALRKQTVEPVFGVIKRVMGWSQMSLRGLAGARGEWSLVTMVWNIKRLHVLRRA